MPCRCVPAVEVTIYRLPNSAEGDETLDFFQDKGVAFKDLDVSADPQARQQMIDLSGQIDRPVIVVNHRVLIGFDLAQLEGLVPSLF